MHLTKFCPESCEADASRSLLPCDGCWMSEAKEVQPRAVMVSKKPELLVGEVGERDIFQGDHGYSFVIRGSPLVKIR